MKSSRRVPRAPDRHGARAPGHSAAHPRRAGGRAGATCPRHTTAAGSRSLWVPCFPRLSWPTSINSRHPAQLSQLLARVEHARLYRVLRNADDLRHLLDRFLVVVDQIDYFPVFPRQRGEALSQLLAFVELLDRNRWII